MSESKATQVKLLKQHHQFLVERLEEARADVATRFNQVMSAASSDAPSDIGVFAEYDRALERCSQLQAEVSDAYLQWWIAFASGSDNELTPQRKSA